MAEAGCGAWLYWHGHGWGTPCLPGAPHRKPLAVLRPALAEHSYMVTSGFLYEHLTRGVYDTGIASHGAL